MANRSGPQPDIRYCPISKENLRNIPPHEMKSPPRSDHAHTYECTSRPCSVRFEINQAR